jgi:hypothetical protein
VQGKKRTGLGLLTAPQCEMVELIKDKPWGTTPKSETASLTGSSGWRIESSKDAAYV